MKPAELRKGALWVVLAAVSALIGAVLLGHYSFWVAVGIVSLCLWLLLTTNPVRSNVNRWILRRTTGITDTFARPDRKLGWGRATNGATWKPVTKPPRIWIRDSRGVIGFSGRNDQSQWVALDNYVVGACKATVRFAVSGEADGELGPTAGIFLCWQETDHTQYLARYDGVKESVDFMVGPVGRKPNGKDSFDTLERQPYSVTPNETYFLRVAVSATRYFVSIWPETEPEPTTWTLRGTIPQMYLRQNGGVGLYGFGMPDGPNVSFHDYTVDDGFTPPGEDVLRGADR